MLVLADTNELLAAALIYPLAHGTGHEATKGLLGNVLIHPSAERADDDGRPRVIMELVRGRSLQDLPTAERALPLSRVAQIGLQALRGSEHALWSRAPNAPGRIEDQQEHPIDPERSQPPSTDPIKRHWPANLEKPQASGQSELP
ncbi:hypothetical protein [Spongiactinospora sp. 9N601]|uniref:hypothetical protein n=1 Tax=Spongiactinospora sp. 9N601 TaxID=3375149 RepID=UPI0037B5F77D